MSIGSMLGKLNPTTIKSKLLLAGGIALLVFIVWFGTKWDSWKIERLEKENQKLDIENQSSKQAAEDAKSVRVIDENAVAETLDRQKAAEDNSNEIQEQVRNDVRRLQREREQVERELESTREEVAKLERARTELERPEPEPAETSPVERARTQSPKVVVDRKPVQVPAVDARVARRIVDGMWDNYCGQVPDDRNCPTRGPDAEGDGSAPAGSGSVRFSQ